MTDDRERWKSVQTDYQRALAIARASWPADAAETVIQAACATILIEFSRRPAPRAAVDAPIGTTAPPAATNGAGAPACPKCGTPTLPVVKKNPRQPDFRCPVADCDAGVWIGRKAGAGK